MAMIAHATPARTGKLSDGFTLVEMLVVIVLMGFMMAIALPRFTDIGRGSKIKTAVSELRSTMGLARQWAIARRESVYMVFPDDFLANLFSGVSTSHYSKALRSYALYSEREGYIKDWTYLPESVFFVDHQNSQNFKGDADLDAGKSVFRMNTLVRLPFPEKSSPTKPINTIEFKPDGTSSGGDISPCEVFMSEGIALEGSGGKVVNIAWKDVSLAWGVEVNPFTGSVRVNDYGNR